LYTKIGAIIFICSVLNISTCYCIFLSESCGIFLQDFQLGSSEHGDVLQGIIETLQQKQTTRIQSLIIKNQLSQREIYPDIFRSMKVDCYLYVHINFGNDLFSTLPPFENHMQIIFYKKATFMIFVKSDPLKSLRPESRKLQLDRQYRIFVVRIKVNLHYTQQQKGKSLLAYQTYFFCSFCSLGLIRLDSLNNILSLQLSSFKKSWMPDLSKHHYQVYQETHLKNQEFCRQQNLMYVYRVYGKCSHHQILSQLIVFASGGNFTLKIISGVRYNYLKIPQIFDNLRSLNNYWSIVLKHYEYRSIIHCFNLRRVSVAETSMWTKYVPMKVWCLVGLCLLLPAILITSSRCHNLSIKVFVQSVIPLANSLLNIIGIIWRQSWNHKWKLLGFLELCFTILISVYENSITVSIVVPLVPKPFVTIEELYNNNYTFIVQIDSSNAIYRWLCDEYNTFKKFRVLHVNNFNWLGSWLERFFPKYQNETKYAIVGDLSKHFHFQAVTFLKEKQDTCYHMYPAEEAFYPEQVYFTFASPLAPLLSTGATRLQAHGFVQAFQAANDFKESISSVAYLRYLASKSGYNGISYRDLKNNRLLESMITLGNIKSVLYLGLILIISGGLAFVAEVTSIEIYLMMLTNSQKRQRIDSS